MGIHDLFSKRQKRARGEVPDVYIYDELPGSLRIQIVHIIRDAFGTDHYGHNLSEGLYDYVNKVLCKEYGVFHLTTKRPYYTSESIFEFFLQEKQAERALDVIELCFNIVSGYIASNQDNYSYFTDRGVEAEDAVSELNERFREHGVGYQFESGEIIRVDSEFLHAEAVKPTLRVLRGEKFEGANEEFLSAHEHYRHGRHKECLVDALKSFESTMKAICE
ncbi:hypothetical protein HUS91_33305, partial [Pseudomonas chlororaphis]